MFREENYGDYVRGQKVPLSMLYMQGISKRYGYIQIMFSYSCSILFRNVA